MNAIQTLLSSCPIETAAKGAVLRRRTVELDDVLYIESGRVLTGVIGDGDEADLMEHQLGATEGPNWLSLPAAVLDRPSVVDAVAQTPVQFRRVPVAQFRACLDTCADSARSVLGAMALAHRQQIELAVSRLAKDAEARCAEWLLSQAQDSDKGGCSVHLQQRKRAIAAHLGIAPETLSRVLRHMRERSLISGSGRVVNLVDPRGLRVLAGISAAPAPCGCGLA
ncbi:MAG: Crp/Fnr family transcriptional regulator [Rhodoferax sp.]